MDINLQQSEDIQRDEQTNARTFQRRERVVENVGASRRIRAARLSQLVWLIFGILNGLIGLRVLLKLLAANPENPFARLVYGLSDVFLWPFAGLTITPSAGGIVLEVPAVIAIFVYALIGWVLVRLVWILFGSTASRQVEVHEQVET